MCDFCVRFGEGMKWYLNPKNFSDEMLNSERVQRDLTPILGKSLGVNGSMIDILAGPQRMAFEEGNGLLIDAAIPDLANRDVIKVMGDFTAEYGHGGQVVPLEDALKIVDLHRGGTLAQPCYCRKYYGAIEKYSCLWFYPATEVSQEARPWEEMKPLSKEETKDLIRQFDQEGLYHAVYYAPVPYPIVMCNCEYPYCIALRARMEYGIKEAVLKGHSVAVVNPDHCDGCEGSLKCMTRCPFGAIRYSPSSRRITVDPFACFGCGLCRDVCDRGALRLVDRTAFPSLKDAW
jgi:Fe-S-cluster-containing hydrogenase component 2